MKTKFIILRRQTVDHHTIIFSGIHSNGRTTNGRTTYSRTTYNRTVSAMVCTINNRQCDHLTNQGDEMNIHIFEVSFFRFKVEGYGITKVR